MDLITAEKATYVISYFSDLLTAPEKQALRHHRSTIKSACPSVPLGHILI
ncbi:hypothetical protein [Mucilaginibacter gotjawali]|uniref:Uncharacterized protein n=2 Tax=Mucilaginibacter gotjawali TaxID=1550579 RepID=A0A110B0X1_9SPHI|nr:hypothetical protein [Mucilaginibacter gotjawali]MBB3058620.1 hypothetical protein [Mucilaginibacter gotjawali]BAU52413.1 hypothetical protein MgSA37_00570 [Mucilaginibacter gotjawali]